MNKLLDALGAMILVGGIIAAWFIIPLLFIMLGTGFIIYIFYLAFQEDRKT